jgi:D-serine deaminase-like pyridoxal phosphate-dependent protein
VPLSYDDFRRLLENERLPALVVDVDAFDANLDRVLARVPRSLPIRIATKSIRVPRLIGRLLDRGEGRLRGLMCYAVAEAALLAHEGFDDLFVAYPPMQKSDLDLAADLAARGITISLAFDDVMHLERFSRVARAKDVRLRAVLCIDMSLRLAGDRLHLGVRRSPVATAEQAVAVARAAKGMPGVFVHGVMGYEAQVAGLADDRPDDLTRFAKRAVRGASVGVVRRRRKEIVEALRADGHDITLVNGGGTGSLDSTTRDPIVTEVTCGSAFFKPHAFDHFTSTSVQELEPACFFALEVTRVPTSRFATCLGGGYNASGAAGSAALPRPWLPKGASLIAAEGAGEVQTPVKLPRHAQVRIGDPIIFRHAKAGEVCERFMAVLLVAGGKVVDRAPTYRGLNACFF